ncbi:11883_t:CDS:2 [Diversispora eburnea]|uniref:11883_t:CDS:1 n=1 Tax=Diversispora eburnea TaxID=1213867 RepID=A0A9N8W2C4_9GLOM|nr:11883_t:CDS:2 [Diversispora eburnea]
MYCITGGAELCTTLLDKNSNRGEQIGFGAIFEVEVLGTILLNKLNSHLDKLVDYLPPEITIDALKKFAFSVRKLSPDIRQPVIQAYVDALQSAYTAIIPVFPCLFLYSRK